MRTESTAGQDQEGNLSNLPWLEGLYESKLGRGGKLHVAQQKRFSSEIKVEMKLELT